MSLLAPRPLPELTPPHAPTPMAQAHTPTPEPVQRSEEMHPIFLPDARDVSPDVATPIQLTTPDYILYKGKYLNGGEGRKNLKDVTFTSQAFSEAVLAREECDYFSKPIQFKNVTFDHCRMPGKDWRGVEMVNLRFKDSEISGITSLGDIMEEHTFGWSSSEKRIPGFLSSVTFDDCTLTGTLEIPDPWTKGTITFDKVTVDEKMFDALQKLTTRHYDKLKRDVVRYTSNSYMANELEESRRELLNYSIAKDRIELGFNDCQIRLEDGTYKPISAVEVQEHVASVGTTTYRTLAY